MRIDEVIKPTWHDPVRTSNTAALGDYNAPGDGFLGKGSFAKAVIDPEDPHMILRKEFRFTHDEDNGFLHWAKAISEEFDSNPFLPRIYDIETEVDEPKLTPNPKGLSPFWSQAPQWSGQRARHTYKIERLFPGQSLTKKQIIALFEANFDEYEDFITGWYTRAGETTPTDWNALIKSISVDDLWDDSVRYMRHLIVRNETAKIKSPELIKANEIIKKAASERIGRETNMSDIYQHNVMVRLYPLHLVITDPIA